jgi:hypothetical protein
VRNPLVIPYISGEKAIKQSVGVRKVTNVLKNVLNNTFKSRYKAYAPTPRTAIFVTAANEYPLITIASRHRLYSVKKDTSIFNRHIMYSFEIYNALTSVPYFVMVKNHTHIRKTNAGINHIRNPHI